MQKILSTTLIGMVLGVGSLAHAAEDLPSIQKDNKAAYIIKSSVGVNSSGDQDVCGDSELTERKMRFFVQHALASTAFNYQKAMITGDCTAEGFIRSKNGKTYRLTIDSATGWAALAVGNRTRYLYCERCEGILDKDFSLD
ncbi:hypothetical protein LJR129_003929 [Acidovorax sp. LjRoot129]|uniref:hypothetical protein n=1 Tax=Acidovorax sp. LjRoot129 TaxID=3342260 RepID=UPI003ECD0DF0